MNVAGWRPREWRFTRLRTRLAVRYAAMFAVAMVAVAAVAQVMIWNHARGSVQAAMTSAGAVNVRLEDLTCAGTPVVEPYTGRMVGSFSLACSMRDVHPLMTVMAGDSLKCWWTMPMPDRRSSPPWRVSARAPAFATR